MRHPFVSALTAPLPGFVIGACLALVVDLTITKTLGLESRAGDAAWSTFNYPTMPFVSFLCLPLVGPVPMGEAEWMDFDYVMVTFAFVDSCLSWGVIGALIGAFLGWACNRPTPPSGLCDLS